MSDFEPTKDPEKIIEEFNEMIIGELKETLFEIDGLIAAIKSILEELDDKRRSI